MTLFLGSYPLLIHDDKKEGKVSSIFDHLREQVEYKSLSWLHQFFMYLSCGKNQFDILIFMSINCPLVCHFIPGD